MMNEVMGVRDVSYNIKKDITDYIPPFLRDSIRLQDRVVCAEDKDIIDYIPPFLRDGMSLQDRVVCVEGEGLSGFQKRILKEEYGYSDEQISDIHSWEDFEEKQEISRDSCKDAENSDVDAKDLTKEEIDKMQKDAITEAFEKIARGEKLTDTEKGNLGEMLMDQYYISKGYSPIHQPRVTDLERKSGHGIDGVYEKTNPDGTKSYVISDAKVNYSKLNKNLADGTDQMSDAWIDKRLDDAVGKEKADEIRDAYEDNPDSVSKEVYHYSYGENADGTSTADVSTVDKDGNMSKDKDIVQVFDENGDPITGDGKDDQRQ